MIKKHSSALLALSFFFLICIVQLCVTLKINGGKFSYPIDDAYIHMAIAKHAVVNGVWGVTPYEFSSTTSSPLYTFLLAAVFYCFGINALAPLVLNLIFTTLLIFVIDYILRKYERSFNERLATLIFITLFTPLPILTIIGMEHVLQLVFTILFIHTSAQVLSKAEILKGDIARLIMIGALLSFIRYEGLFIILPVCFLFLLRKNITIGMLLGLGSLIPLFLYGLISVNEGSYWLPNSVLLKGQEVKLLSFSGIKNLYERPLFVFSQAPWLFIIAVFVIILGADRAFRLKLSVWNSGQIMIVVFITALLFHLEFARVGWAYRYEAYLMGLGILLLGMFGKETFYTPFKGISLMQRISIGLLILVLSVPILGRGLSALLFSSIASKNIYEQQYQMGLFLRKFYNNQPVIAGDIGAINFLADLKCLDIIGLGSIEIAKARREGQFNSGYLNTIVNEKKIGIAVVYDHELVKNPVDWEKVAEWRIQNNVITASDKVSFYAIEKSEANHLLSNLKMFENELPATVEVTYY